MFNTLTYRERRAKLVAKVKHGIILLLGNNESSINFKDNWYPFRQDSTFLYYTGLSKPDMALMIDCDSGAEMLVGEDLTIDEIVWTGPQPTVRDLAEQAGLAHTTTFEKLSRFLQEANKSGRVIHTLPPYRHEHTLQLAEYIGWPVAEVSKKASVSLIEAVVAQRNIKSAEEIAAIDAATKITAAMHTAAIKAARPGMKEYELVALMHQTAQAAGGMAAFPVIMTKNGQTLHNHYYGNTIAEGDMVLCDTGAEIAGGYCGDMTRTFTVAKTFTERQKALYQIVLDAHEAAVAALRPGVYFRDIHLLACEHLFEGLKAMGITKGDTKEAVAAGAHTMFFQCGLGHMMGLDVHDMENLGEQYVGYTPALKKSTEFGLKSLRLGRQLEKGFVLTVEPGIYIIPELIDLWKSENKHDAYINYAELENYRDFGGIRLEEDFAITASGAQLLGTPVAKTIADVEALRQY